MFIRRRADVDVPCLAMHLRVVARTGFTLIEVIIGLTILAMITGTLFAIIRGAVAGAADIERVQRENDSISRLIEIFRQTFQTLPSTATLSLKITEQTDPLMQELTIGGAPHSFCFGANPISYKNNIIGLRPDTVQTATADTNQPRFYLCLSREDLIPKSDDGSSVVSTDVNSMAAPDDQGRYWMPLLAGVTGFAWKFYKQSDDTWEDEWSSSKWPDLIEMNLYMEGRTQPIRAVYSVPTLSLRAATSKGGSSSGSSGKSSTSTAPSGGGGAPPGGGGAPPSSGGGGR